jgi:hypothetical protein
MYNLSTTTHSRASSKLPIGNISAVLGSMTSFRTGMLRDPIRLACPIFASSRGKSTTCLILSSRYESADIRIDFSLD